MIAEDEESKSESDCPFHSKNDFEDFLVSLSINHTVDYKLTDSKKETMRIISDIIISVIDSKYKSEIGIFDTKT